MFHHEFGTQQIYAKDEQASYRRRNHVRFNGKWGASLRRRILLERLGKLPAQRSTPRPPTVSIGDSESSLMQDLTQGLAQLGWMVDTGEVAGKNVDLLVVDDLAMPLHASVPLCVGIVDTVEPVDQAPNAIDLVLTRAPITGQPQPWLAAPGVFAPPREGVAADTDRARALLEHVTRVVEQPSVGIRHCAPDPRRAPLWGDTHYAESFADAFRRRGMIARAYMHSQWDEPRAHIHDIVVHLRGLKRYEPQPGATNVMWLVSHPEDVTPDELDDFDLVLVASSTFAKQLAPLTSTPVQVMHQATDIRRFSPLREDPALPASGVVVVENARFPGRRAPRWLMELGIDFTLHGAHWAGYPEERMVANENVPNDQLRHVYSQADIVVSDQWDQMAREGFVANRLFDVAATGGFVISDDGPGISEVFGDCIPTYRSRKELGQLVRHYLAHPGERHVLAQQAMALVRKEHSFDARAEQLLGLLGVTPQPSPWAEEQDHEGAPLLTAAR
jgi:hypothetical protein